MATNADSSVAIEFDADVSDVEKKIGRLKTEITNLETKISEKKFKHNRLQEQISALRTQIKEAAAESERLQGVYEKDPTNEKAEAAYRRSAEHVRKLTEELEKARTAANKLADSIEKDETDLEAMKYAGGELQAEINAVESSISNRLSSGIEKVRNKMGSILSKIKSAATKASKAFLSLFKSSNKTNSSFVSGIKTMLKYSLGIRGLYALFGKLRSAMTEGFKNLAQYSDSTNASISMVKSALTQLKNSLATAFAPILTTVAPILTQFINMLSTAADYVARLTAALTGQKSYTRATKVQEDYAASLEGTAQAAEDAAGSLAGFDEINTITTENASGGSSSGTSPSEMFEEVAIEPLSFDSWGQAFSAFLDNILNNGIPKLKDGLSAFAGWINTFSANLYEMFTFPGVYDKVVALGTELAYAMNGFVNQIDWATIGGALGAGLNLALGFLVSFIYNFDWLNLGASLATMINNAVAEIDWYNVGMLLWAKFKIAIETFAGFLANLDPELLASAINDMVSGLTDAILGTLETIDWQAIGSNIGTFLAGIDWLAVLESVFAVIWETVSGLLDGLWAGITSYFENADLFETVLSSLAIAIGVVEVALAAYNAVSTIAAVVTSALTSPITLVIAAITALIAIIALCITHWDEIKTAAASAWEGIKSAFAKAGEWFRENVMEPIQEAWEDLKTGFKNVWNGIVGLLESAVNLIISGVNWLITQLNKVSFTVPDWVPVIGGKSYGINIPKVSEVSIPRLATGAVIPPNREFMAVLGDQKSGYNIEAPEDLIRKIVREEAGSNDNTALLQAILEAIQAGQVIKVNEMVLGRTTAKAINKLTQSSGKPVLSF